VAYWKKVVQRVRRGPVPPRSQPALRRAVKGSDFDDFQSRRRLWRGLAGAWYGTVVTFVPSPKGGRHADLTLAGFPWPSPLAGLRSRVSRWSPGAQQGRRYPADPPRTEEIIAVMRCCGDGLHRARARGLIVMLWRAASRKRSI